MQDTTDWHLCMKCANVFHQITRKSGPTTAVTAGRIRNTRPARVDEHYVLECIDCGFTQHIPSESVSSSVKYSVDMGEVKMICVFGGEVTVTLEVKDFFSIKPVPQSRQVLHTSISNNMVPLRGILKKCVHSQAVYPLSEQHGLKARERRYTAHEEGKHWE